MDHVYWLLTSFHCVKITINFFSMVFDFATIAFNGFQWFRTIGLAIAEMIGQLLTLTIWSNLDKFHYILGGSILSFRWKSEALTASVANFSVFTQPNISVTGSHSGSLVQYKCKKSTSGQCLLFHSAQYASDTNKHKEHNATKAIHASRCKLHSSLITSQLNNTTYWIFKEKDRIGIFHGTSSFSPDYISPHSIGSSPLLATLLFTHSFTCFFVLAALSWLTIFANMWQRLKDVLVRRPATYFAKFSNTTIHKLCDG